MRDGLRENPDVVFFEILLREFEQVQIVCRNSNKHNSAATIDPVRLFRVVTSSDCRQKALTRWIVIQYCFGWLLLLRLVDTDICLFATTAFS